MFRLFRELDRKLRTLDKCGSHAYNSITDRPVSVVAVAGQAMWLEPSLGCSLDSDSSFSSSTAAAPAAASSRSAQVNLQ